MTLNAFAAGTPDNAVIGITEGLLRRLALPELAGVLAHEISHVRNNDLAILGLADAMTRFAQLLAYLAVFLALFNLPAFLLGDSEIPLIVLALLYLAPTAGSLIQLALSRTRELDADLEAASLTGDPESLISALQKLERYHGHFWEDMRLPVPGRRIPQPSLLRSHPKTEDRVARLKALRDRALLPRLAVTEEPMAPLAGHRPRRHAPPLPLDRRVVLKAARPGPRTRPRRSRSLAGSCRARGACPKGNNTRNLTNEGRRNCASKRHWAPVVGCVRRPFKPEVRF